MVLPGEDQHGFRAIAQRSMLADAVKDSGAASMFPKLAEDWATQVDAQANWKQIARPGLLQLSRILGASRGWFSDGQESRESPTRTRTRRCWSVASTSRVIGIATRQAVLLDPRRLALDDSNLRVGSDLIFSRFPCHREKIRFNPTGQLTHLESTTCSDVRLRRESVAALYMRPRASIFCP